MRRLSIALVLFAVPPASAWFGYSLGPRFAEPRYVPRMIRWLGSEYSSSRREAAENLEAIGPAAKAAAPALVLQLNDVEVGTRIAAARALLHIGTEEKAAVNTLTDLLRNDNVNV